MINPAQSRAGRALIDWSQERLAAEAHLGVSTIRDFEKGRRVPTHNNLAAIRAALEAAGVIFIESNGEAAGVRLRSLRVGDLVRWVAGVPLAQSFPGTDNAVGTVIDLVKDGTSLKRVSVEFPDGQKALGVVESQFELERAG